MTWSRGLRYEGRYWGARVAGYERGAPDPYLSPVATQPRSSLSVRLQGRKRMYEASLSWGQRGGCYVKRWIGSWGQGSRRQWGMSTPYPVTRIEPLPARRSRSVGRTYSTR